MLLKSNLLWALPGTVDTGARISTFLSTLQRNSIEVKRHLPTPTLTSFCPLTMENLVYSLEGPDQIFNIMQWCQQQFVLCFGKCEGEGNASLAMTLLQSLLLYKPSLLAVMFLLVSFKGKEFVFFAYLLAALCQSLSL
jgi:hypothetical protein